MRIFSLLTGGIDLPKLVSDVADTRSAIDKAATQGRPHLGPLATVADVIYWLRCRIDKLDNLVDSRALKEDVETLRLKLERRDDEFHSRTMVLTREIQELTATVAGLSAKVEALTAAKLSDVRSRKKAS